MSTIHVILLYVTLTYHAIGLNLSNTLSQDSIPKLQKMGSHRVASGLLQLHLQNILPLRRCCLINKIYSLDHKSYRKVELHDALITRPANTSGDHIYIIRLHNDSIYSGVEYSGGKAQDHPNTVGITIDYI